MPAVVLRRVGAGGASAGEAISPIMAERRLGWCRVMPTIAPYLQSEPVASGFAHWPQEASRPMTPQEGDMTRHTIAAGLAVLLAAPAGAAAAEPAAAPIAATASRESQRAAPNPTRRGAMPNGLKWTGLGLIMGSGMPVVGGALSDCFASERSCRRGRHAMYALGGVMAGTGVALLFIADHKRPQVPIIVSVAPGRASIAHRITF
jgi:hypothetical protein